MRAWFSTDMTPSPGGKQFLDQVVLFVVQRRAAERADVGDMVERQSVCGSCLSSLCPASALTRCAICSIAHASGFCSQRSE